MKKVLLLLITVFLLAGCAASKSIPETEPAATPAAQIAVVATQVIPTTEETTQPTEPNLPWDPDVRWYGTYYFEKKPIRILILCPAWYDSTLCCAMKAEKR